MDDQRKPDGRRRRKRRRRRRKRRRKRRRTASDRSCPPLASLRVKNEGGRRRNQKQLNVYRGYVLSHHVERHMTQQAPQFFLARPFFLFPLSILWPQVCPTLRVRLSDSTKQTFFVLPFLRSSGDRMSLGPLHRKGKPREPTS